MLSHEFHDLIVEALPNAVDRRNFYDAMATFVTTCQERGTLESMIAGVNSGNAQLVGVGNKWYDFLDQVSQLVCDHYPGETIVRDMTVAAHNGHLLAHMPPLDILGQERNHD